MNTHDKKKELAHYFEECTKKINTFYQTDILDRVKNLKPPVSVSYFIKGGIVIFYLAVGYLDMKYDDYVAFSQIPSGEKTLFFLAWVAFGICFILGHIYKTSSSISEEEIAQKAGTLLNLNFKAKENLMLPNALKYAQQMNFCSDMTPLYGFWGENQGRVLDMLHVAFPTRQIGEDLYGYPYGWVFQCNLATRLEGITFLVSDSLSAKIRGKIEGLHRVKLEWPEFEESFDLFSSDEIDARVIMSPDFMEIVHDFFHSLKNRSLKKNINPSSFIFIFCEQDMTLLYESDVYLNEKERLFLQGHLRKWFLELAFLCRIPDYLNYKAMASEWQDEKEIQTRINQEILTREEKRLQAYACKDVQTLTPLMNLILQSQSQAFAEEIKKPYSNPNERYAPNGNTLLHLAALNGETDMVKALLAHPYIQTNVQNNQGQTPLDVAQDRRQTDVVAVFEHFYQNH